MNRLFVCTRSSILAANRSRSFKKIFTQQRKQLCASADNTASCSDYSVVIKDQTSIANALNLSVKTKSSILGAQIHAHIFKLGFSDDVFSLNNLVRMYSKCGYFHVGLRVFDEMAEAKRNLVSWTLIISGAAQNCEFQMGFEAFLKMRRNGLLPNEFALGSVFKIFTSFISSSTGGSGFILGLCIHSLALKIAFEKNHFVASSIMNTCAKWRDIEACENVFESVTSYGDVVCWNAMMGSYAQCGFGFRAVKMASLMHSEGLLLDEYTFINALNGCSVLGNLDHGKQIHGLIIMYGMVQSTSVMTSLVDVYFKSGRKSYAVILFDSMRHKDVVSWNTIFSGFSQDPDAQRILSLFNNFMYSGLKPNSTTFSILINLCRDICDPCLGLQFYSLALHYGLSCDSLVVSSLISMFSRYGSTEMARLVYDNAPSKSISNLNAMISGYSLNHDKEALRLFHDLWATGLDASDITISCALEACLNAGDTQAGKQIHGIIVKCGLAFNTQVCGSLVKFYVQFGLLNESLKFFYGPIKPHLVTWGIMVSVLGHQGHSSEAMKFLKYMKKIGERPDDFVLSSILNSCASLGSHCLTKSVHSVVTKMGFELHMSVASAIIDAYSKCGDLESAKIAFCLSSSAADIVVFNTMIMAYAHHGLPLEAMQIFQEMKVAKLKPSQATFVSVLSACRHAGLIDLGRNLFKSISLDYGMEPSPDNYGCLVDLLSRNGFIKEARSIIELMPFPPWPAIWRSLLNGCIVHGNRKLGEWAYRKLFQFFPNDHETCILYSKLYSEHGSWEDAAKLRNEMIEEGVQKDAGCSRIEV